MNKRDRDLMERYIYQVVRRLPGEQRKEVGLELQELIGDMWEEAEAAKADAQDAPEEEEMSRGKRMLVQIVSVLAFILLIWLVVMGTDWIANNLWSWVQNQGL